MAYERIKLNFRERAFLDLKEIKNVYDKLGIKFFLINGTLLGAVREKNVILTDHDVDLGLYGEDNFRGDEIYQAFKDAGFLVGSGESFQCPDEKLRRPIWFLTHRNVKIEHIFMFKKKDKRVMWYTTRGFDESKTGERLMWENDAKFFEPLEATELCGEKFPIPNHAEELLDLFYKEWKIPSGAQVWGNQCPREWKSFNPLEEICDFCSSPTKNN